jgi:hypothetical protein
MAAARFDPRAMRGHDIRARSVAGAPRIGAPDALAHGLYTRPMRATRGLEALRLHGVDFTSAPRARKPITVASAAPPAAGALALRALEALTSLEAFDAWLRVPGPWVAAFDFPFGFARGFVAAQGWPLDGPRAWAEVTARVGALSRPALIARCRAWCDARPAGSKFAHRACDASAGSSASMKWVNPPVALMLHAGAPRLLAAGARLPGLLEDGRTDPQRVALEGYPGLLARAVLGRASYKSDAPGARTDAARRAARERLVTALETGEHPAALRVGFGALREACVDDPGADRLDAVLCLVQAAWAWGRRDAGWGLPAAIDPLEGWIVGA